MTKVNFLALNENLSYQKAALYEAAHCKLIGKGAFLNALKAIESLEQFNTHCIMENNGIEIIDFAVFTKLGGATQVE